MRRKQAPASGRRTAPLKPRLAFPRDEPEPAGLAARRVALHALDAVLRRQRPLDETLEADPVLPALAVRDRAFAMHLASTVLRRLGQIDRLIDGCLARPLPQTRAPVRQLLRLGVAQLLFSRTPPHAAVHTAVALLQETGAEEHAALLNAVLRRLAREGETLLADQDAPRLNTPGWLWHAWTDAYGEATTRAIAEAHLGEPPLDLTPRHAADAPRLAEELGAARLLSGTLRLVHAGPVTALPGLAEGRWWVQDAAAALPALLLGHVAGRRVVDLCAAPGGKTAQLAAAGAHVVAVDRSPARLRQLAENLQRLHLTAELVEADAAAWRPDAPLDRILLDVPCSSTGTIRRHPDVARLKGPDDVGRLAVAQQRLLAAAAAMLAPGGVLVYCACSLQPEEGAARIDSLLADARDLHRLPVRPHEIGGCADVLTSVGDLRTLPCHLSASGGMDGFYAARIRRDA